MDLLGIRKQVIEYSGRYDLVIDTHSFVDNGADYFIKEGLRELDRDRFQHHYSAAIRYTVLAAGDYIASVTRSRVINNVFCGDGDSFKRLTYSYYEELREDFAKALGSVESGTPLYWRPINLRHSPGPDRIESDLLDAISSYVDVTTTNFGEYNWLLILPPPSIDITLEVHGLFYSDPLESDEDTNYWSLKEPGILVMAAMRELERSYRNLTGAQEWTDTIRQKLEGMDLDLVAEQSSKFDQMRG